MEGECAMTNENQQGTKTTRRNFLKGQVWLWPGLPLSVLRVRQRGSRFGFFQ